jgi:hypothetical protein
MKEMKQKKIDKSLSKWYVRVLYLSTDHRVHTEWRLPISSEHPIMMERSTLAGEGGGVYAHPLSAYFYLYHVQSCSVRSC